MKEANKITESTSHYDHLESMSVTTLLKSINTEDKSVPLSVEKSLSQIESLTKSVTEQLKKGGRLFYLGAGTSGRLGILDASECPPTFGVSSDLVIGLIAGGDRAIRKAVEQAEDDPRQAWLDLERYAITKSDIVIGLATSGTTPYVVGGLEDCQKNEVTTGCITCNPESPLAEAADFPVEVIVGPEVVTGSSRMKAGTAQKMVLNMVSTAVMVQLGRVEGNKMVDMQLSNAKLLERGTKLICDATDASADKARQFLKHYGSVRKAIEFLKSN